MSNNKETKTHKRISQIEIVKQYFVEHPGLVETHVVVDWAVKRYKQLTGKVLRDPDRLIRKLHQQGFLIKHDKGQFEYVEKFVNDVNYESFTEKQKEAIFTRDGRACAHCGRGEKEGVQLHIDHIKPRAYAGKATLENGQVLCSECNLLKKKLNHTTLAKRFFINLLRLAKKEPNMEKLIDFSTEILTVYEKYDVNGDLKWEDDKK